MPHVTIPRMLTPTTTPTTMRIILSALLPPRVGGGAGRGVCDGSAVAGDMPAGFPVTAAPHLLQNWVPAFRVAPQELQNAIGHLASGFSLTREYTSDWGGRGQGV